LAGFSILVLICSISSFIFLKINPIAFRQFIFQPLRDSLFFYQELNPLTGVKNLSTAPVFKNHQIEIPAHSQQDLKLTADLWEPASNLSANPAILLLHGSSPRGRRDALIRMLAHEFQKRGWIVLTPDARGFGESDDPAAIQDSASWQIAADIRRCIDYLLQLPNIDKNRCVVFGHSMGAGDALEGALEDPRLKALILVGPPRYIQGPIVTFWERVRFSAVRNLPEVVTEKVMHDRIVASDIAGYARDSRLKKAARPILLLDGALEGEMQRRFLQEIASQMAPSSAYKTIEDAGHYCGVYQLPGLGLIFYRRDILESCIAPTMAFLSNAFKQNSIRP
jgi:pimeloyl-ACP methyl ester carboxylesterase